MDSQGAKACPQCGQVKSLFDFYFFKSGIATYCKTCCKGNAIRGRRKAESKWTDEQRIAKKIYNAEYRKHYQAKPEVIARRKDAARLHRLKNPEANRIKQRLCRARNRDLSLFRSAQNRAKERNWEFSLTRAWLREKIDKGHCEATGLPFNTGEFKGVGKADPFSCSIDRKNSSKGYTQENCRVVLWGFNMALSQWGEEIYGEIASAYLAKKREQI